LEGKKLVLRGYDPNAQQVWQIAKVLAVDENRPLSTSDLWWGCLAMLPTQESDTLQLELPATKKEHLETVRERRVEKRVSVTPEVTQLDQNLKAMCRSTGVPAATVWHMLLALLEHPDAELTNLWGELKVNQETLREQVQQQIEQSKLPSRKVPLPQEARRVLTQFTRNLTEAAVRGDLTPAYERDTERAAIVRTLLRKTKRNVALVGPAGVGKTKMVEDLALRILNGEIPQLAECEIIALSPTALRAGTSAHGELEKRFERLRNVLEDYGDRLILFIDELHVIVGTAVSSHSLDLANALKPLLASGRIRSIGATTQKEFIQYIERDRALARRFQMIALPEPPREAMEQILKAVSPEYEEHHGVRYSPETLRTILDLGDVYLPNRYYPDKALDILDEAGAWLVMHREEQTPEEPPLVTPEAVKTVLSEILHIPLEDLDAEALPHLADRMGELVVGQDHALQKIQDALISSSGRTVVSQKPRAGMIFIGPQGCGKTFTAQVLAQILCHNRQALMELDLDQVVRSYWHGGGADFLLGPRPPYVGWEHGGILTNHVLNYPQSVILVRGITRAQADVQHLFAGILERGEVEDGRGQRVSFRGVVLLFALESTMEDSRAIGFLSSAQPGLVTTDPMRLRDEVLRLGVLPDLVRQIEEFVPFQPLSTEALRKIASRRLESFRRELYERDGKAIDVEEAMLSHLVTPQVRTAAEAEDKVEQMVILPVNALRSSPQWEQWNTICLLWEEGVSVEPVEPRVLVVDDLPDFFEELQQSYAEYKWYYASGVEEAAQSIDQERPHLVLIDTCFSTSNAEDVGGVAVLKALKERFPLQQMVLVTAQGVDFQTTREAFRVGAYDYLWKPPQESVLRQLVSALAAQEEQERRLVVQEQLLREQWQRSVEETEGGVRIAYHE
jgi:ATP-dependent Clp protease ATP-binding subunit ClpA/ActR/RegA family two-component response regulator